MNTLIQERRGEISIATMCKTAKTFLQKMAWTARKGEDLVEFEEDEETLERHCLELAGLIRGAKHFVAYTGAGVSCSAGIPDFRGGQ